MSWQFIARARSTLRVSFLVLGASCGSGGGDDSSTKTSALSGSNAACDKTPIDQHGTLRACAAGTATRAKPGVPDDYTGPINGALTLNGSELAAQAAAARVDEVRHPPGTDPVELGFPPIPAAARVAPKGVK